MNIIFTGNLEATDIMKNYISSQIVKLAKYAKKIDSASVILTIEKKQLSAVVVIWVDGRSFTSKETTGDIYLSIDSVLTKIESQLKKHRKKRNSKFRKHMNKQNSEFQKYFKRLQEEFNTGVKQRECFKANRNKVYSIIIALETCLNSSGFEFFGIV
jgi:putative sigma-54 modulation protein